MLSRSAIADLAARLGLTQPDDWWSHASDREFASLILSSEVTLTQLAAGEGVINPRRSEAQRIRRRCMIRAALRLKPADCMIGRNPDCRCGEEALDALTESELAGGKKAVREVARRFHKKPERWQPPKPVIPRPARPSEEPLGTPAAPVPPEAGNSVQPPAPAMADVEPEPPPPRRRRPRLGELTGREWLGEQSRALRDIRSRIF